jgi:hypothetical protein
VCVCVFVTVCSGFEGVSVFCVWYSLEWVWESVFVCVCVCMCVWGGTVLSVFGEGICALYVVLFGVVW